MVKLGAALKGKFNIGVVNADESANKPLATRFKIEGFPTIKLFVNGEARDYNGGRSADAMKEKLIELSNKLSKGESTEETPPPPPESLYDFTTDALTQLTTQNIDQFISANTVTLIEF